MTNGNGRSLFGLRVACVLVLALAFVMASSPRAVAQTSTTGGVTGSITDPSGAVVPKADVTLTRTDTNAVEKQSTNESGQFVFSGLTPGTYKITVTAPGFRVASESSLL